MGTPLWKVGTQSKAKGSNQNLEDPQRRHCNIFLIFKEKEYYYAMQVQVCSGDFEGAQGKVIEVRRRENKVLIEGINLVRRNVKRKLN